MNPREFCREKGYPTAILLTYNFDPNFFEQVVLRDLEAGETEDILVIADPNEIATSVGRWKDQVVHLGRKYQVVPVIGSRLFHPKMILRVGPAGNAVWLGSGNLTFGGWGGNQELATSWTSTDQSEHSALLLNLLQNIRSLVPSSPHLDVLGRALTYLKVLPESDQITSDNGPILTSFGADSLSTKLLKRWDGRRFRKVSIFTGSTDENGALIRWLHEKFGIEEAIVVVDQDHSRFSPERLNDIPCNVTVRSFARTKKPLHAKFFWFEGDVGCAAIAGSANCSAAAWLVATEHRGNIEAIAVYDDAVADDFRHILESFREDGLSETVLSEKAGPDPPLTQEILVGTPDISLDISAGLLSIAFPWAKSKIVKVISEIEGETISFEGDDLFWTNQENAVFTNSRTEFLEISITFDGGENTVVLGWVNDLSILRQTSKIRKITEGLLGLSGPQPPSEHRKMLAVLESTSRFLLDGSEAFSDPVRFESSVRTSAEAPETVRAINPDDFVRSIEEINRNETVINSFRDFHENIGVEAVLRAFFGRQLSDAEIVDDDDEFDENSAVANEKKIAKKERERRLQNSEPPDERTKSKFKEIVSAFLRELTEEQFVEKCTVRQFQNAVAHPFVMCYRGLDGGWIDPIDASLLYRQAFDILFLLKHGGRSEFGLLARLKTRFIDTDSLDTFKNVIGDGTLWVLFLVAIGKSVWQGANGAFQRKLAMRQIYQSRDLIESANSGRIGRLIKGPEESQVISLMNDARIAKGEIDKLEEYMFEHFEDLISFQTKHHLPYNKGDLIWIKGGWAEVIDPVGFGENTKVYLHAKAEEKTVCTRLFLNVPGLSKTDDCISDLFATVTNTGQSKF